MSTRVWYLLGRKLADEATLDEIRELETILLENPDLASRVDIHSRYFKENAQKKLSDEGLEAAWERQLVKMAGSFPEAFSKPRAKISAPGRPLQLRAFLKPLAIAASLLIVAFLSWLAFPGHSLSNFFSFKNTVQEISTSSSDKVKTFLPDGSTVWLNGDSRITYDKNFGKSNREITLTGEAFFDVVHKAELPMVVHANKVDVRVKGTAFNVKAYAGDAEVETSLIRGSVELFTVINHHSEKILMKPNEKVVIRVDAPKIAEKQVQQEQVPLFFKLDTLAVESKSGLIPEIAWIQNKMVFNSETFGELSRKMSRWFNVEIVITDHSLSRERFTGVFSNENLSEALSALQFTYRFTYRIDGNKVFISKK